MCFGVLLCARPCVKMFGPEIASLTLAGLTLGGWQFTARPNAGVWGLSTGTGQGVETKERGPAMFPYLLQISESFSDKTIGFFFFFSMPKFKDPDCGRKCPGSKSRSFCVESLALFRVLAGVEEVREASAHSQWEGRGMVGGRGAGNESSVCRGLIVSFCLTHRLWSPHFLVDKLIQLGQMAFKVPSKSDFPGLCM